MAGHVEEHHKDFILLIFFLVKLKSLTPDSKPGHPNYKAAPVTIQLQCLFLLS